MFTRDSIWVLYWNLFRIASLALCSVPLLLPISSGPWWLAGVVYVIWLSFVAIVVKSVIDIQREEQAAPLYVPHFATWRDYVQHYVRDVLPHLLDRLTLYATFALMVVVAISGLVYDLSFRGRLFMWFDPSASRWDVLLFYLDRWLNGVLFDAPAKLSIRLSDVVPTERGIVAQAVVALVHLIGSAFTVGAVVELFKRRKPHAETYGSMPTIAFYSAQSERQADFFSGLLGWAKKRSEKSEHGETPPLVVASGPFGMGVRILEFNALSNLSVFAPRLDPDIPTGSIGLVVADAAKSLQCALKLGAEQAGPLLVSSGGCTVSIAVPGGLVVTLIEMKRWTYAEWKSEQTAKAAASGQTLGRNICDGFHEARSPKQSNVS